MICCNSAFEQGNLDLWRYINALIIIIIIMLQGVEGTVTIFRPPISEFHVSLFPALPFIS